MQQNFSGSGRIAGFALLVHGVAAVLLVALGWSLAPRPRRGTILVIASVAAALSTLQLIGELTLVVAAEGVDAAFVWESVTRTDGVKMLVLALLIGVVHGGRVSGRIVLTVVSALAVGALLISGAGYLTLQPALMDAANASLPLLLLWALVATGTSSSKAGKES